VKTLCTSDLHGETYLYHQLSELAISSSAEIVVLGGDLLPSIRQIEQCHHMIPRQKDFIDQFLRPFLKGLIETTTVKQTFLISGNWDLGYSHLFERPPEGVIDLSSRKYSLGDGHELIGYPFVPPTSFWPKDFEKMDNQEASWPSQPNPSFIVSPDPKDGLRPIDPYIYLRQRDTIRQDLVPLCRSSNYQRTICVMHSPPFGTQLDRIGDGQSVGSRSIRGFIEIYQPLLTLHGHIHESPEVSGHYFDRIGNTLSVNPGQFTCGSKLHAVTFEMENPGKTLHHTCFSDAG